jgi:hypothetical protein
MIYGGGGGDDDDDDCGAVSGTNEWQGKPKYSEETWLNAAVSTTTK